jgi:hypothetical protein
MPDRLSILNPTSLYVLSIVAITFSMLPATLSIKVYAALCDDPTKSTSYFGGYVAAQNDFKAGHTKNENPQVNSTNPQDTQDYKKGYNAGWQDAQININLLENSFC